MKNQEKWADPIVEEVHRIRQEMLQEAGGDLPALGAWLMKSQERHREKLVTHSPQRIKARL